jgi:trk system potassium uptake protein TrkA
MRIIILGSGSIAFSIAKYLSFENDVCVVDENKEMLRKMGDILDVRPVFGPPSHPDSLKKAFAQDADLIIAITDKDEVNITACYIAHTVFGISQKIARFTSSSYFDNSYFPFIDFVINPEQEVSKALKRSIETQGAFDTISFSGLDLKAIGLICQECPILNTPLKLLGAFLNKANLVILWIFRAGQGFIPDGNDELKINDEIYFLTKKEDLFFVMSLFNIDINENRRAIIVGGGNIGFSFAQSIQKLMYHCILIERCVDRSESVAQSLKKIEVLQGDALEILNEMDLGDIETVISVTDDDRVNILTSLLAKQRGARHSLSLLTEPRYSDFAHSLGINGIINPHSIIVSALLKQVRKKSITSLYVLKDAEIIEIKAQEHSHIIGFLAAEIAVEKEIFIAAIFRKGKIFMIPKEVMIQSDDTLIFVCKKELTGKIESLLNK